MKLLLSLLLIAVLVPVITDAQIIRPKDKEDQEDTESLYAKEFGKQDDAYFAKLDFVRIAFVRKGKDGREWAIIRLAPGQFRFAQLRAKIKGKGIKKGGIVRVFLRPRQILALQKAIGDEYRWSKVELRLSVRRLEKLQGLKARYVIRLAEQFKKKGNILDKDDADDKVDKDVEEAVDKKAAEEKEEEKAEK